MTTELRTLEHLSRHQAMTLLGEHEVGRVAFALAGRPVLMPLTYAVMGDSVVLRTSPGSRLATAAAEGAEVALEVDGIDLRDRTGWSVVVTGVPRFVTEAADPAGHAGGGPPWAPGAEVVVLQVPLASVTGRVIVAVR